MIVYWILLLIAAFVAYTVGSLSTLRLASRYVFHRNLLCLGRGSVWISNFRRIFGYWGLARLLLTELVKDLVPILLGGALLALKKHGAVGMAFAGFCLLMGRYYPVFNRFRGSHGAVALVTAALFVSPSVGIAAAGVMLVLIWFTRYVSLGVAGGAAIMLITAVLVVDDRLLMTLGILMAALSLIYHIPALRRITQGKEPKLSLETDITYKLDEKF